MLLYFAQLAQLLCLPAANSSKGAARLSEQVSQYKVKNSHAHASVQLNSQIVRAKRATGLTNKAKHKLLLA